MSTEPELPPRLAFHEGDAIHKPFIAGKYDGHNIASYAIAPEGVKVKQDGTHGVSSDDLIASDEPYYNTAPGYDVAKEMVRRWNLVADMEATNA